MDNVPFHPLSMARPSRDRKQLIPIYVLRVLKGKWVGKESGETGRDRGELWEGRKKKKHLERGRGRPECLSMFFNSNNAYAACPFFSLMKKRTWGEKQKS